jgi:NADPH-dependent curcumin reductase
MSLLVNRGTMTGFLVFDFADRYAQAAEEMAGWMQEGRLKSYEDVATGGVEQFPDTLLRLFNGDNLGKLVLEVDPG